MIIEVDFGTILTNPIYLYSCTMMKKFALLVFGMFLFQPLIAQDDVLEVQYRDEVQFFINCIKKKDITGLSKITSFPLERDYPIPSIKDSAEFRARFSEMFDDSLIAMIRSSNVKTDWSRVGWQGIMFQNGTLWLLEDGTLEAVNYQSKIEEKMKTELIENDRKSLHPSLQEFAGPDLIMETSKFRIRIDEMEDGTYRYASWSVNSKMSNKPDLILKNGSIEFSGSGGNHNYTFKNKEYSYVCDIIVLGMDDSPPAKLLVYKRDKEILNQDATIYKP